MKRSTLLELVQAVSRHIGDKERFGLDEDLRVQDVAHLCVTTLEGLCSRRTWEFLRDRVLVCSEVTDKVSVQLPLNLAKVNQAKYVVNGSQTELCYQLPEVFLAHVGTASDFTEEVALPGGGTIHVQNNQPPRYYTSFDEKSITLDSYDNVVDVSGIQATKVILRAEIELDTSGALLAGLPVDTWTPDIPTRMFTLWFWECVVNCSATIIGVEDPTAKREARRQYVKMLDLEPKTQRDESNRAVNYGRRYNY